MRLGLIAGNGRFPFLVLAAARAAGDAVTIIAIKEEAFPRARGTGGSRRRAPTSTGCRSGSSARGSAS